MDGLRGESSIAELCRREGIADAGKLTATISGQFGAAPINGELPDDASVDADDNDLDEEAIVGSLKVLASIQQERGRPP